MDMSVSPDVDAYICYLLVLILGIVTAAVQVSEKLKNLPGKWIMLNTWSLFAAYTAIPLALFWFLDRTNAIHDTSLFAAILVGVGYQQILSTGLSSIRAPGDATKIWQPFDAWVNSIAARIRDRVAINSTKFDEKLLTGIIRDEKKFDLLKEITFAHTSDVVQLDARMREVDLLAGILDDRGTRSKKASLLYTTLRQSCPQTFQFLLRKSKVITSGLYFWYAKEWRSKFTATIVALILAGGAAVGTHKLLSPRQRSNYYVWRLRKSNATDADRYRSKTYLLANIDSDGSTYQQLGDLLKTPTLDSTTADNVLALLLNNGQETSGRAPKLHDVLIDALHNTNSDIRGRIQKVLLYLAKKQSLAVDPNLANWQSDSKDSASDVDLVIEEWNQAWKGSSFVAPSVPANQSRISRQQ